MVSRAFVYRDMDELMPNGTRSCEELEDENRELREKVSKYEKFMSTLWPMVDLVEETMIEMGLPTFDVTMTEETIKTIDKNN